MNPLKSPNRNSIGGPIHNANSLSNARRMANRAMDKWGEIRRPLKTGGGFGNPDSGELPTGRVRMEISQANRGEELSPDGEGVSSGIEYEIKVSTTVRLAPDDRIAIPAFFDNWKKGKVYTLHDMVLPRNITAGSGPIFECLRPGMSANVEPNWPSKVRAVVADGPIVWRLVGYVTMYEVIAVALQQSQPTQIIVKCKELN